MNLFKTLEVKKALKRVYGSKKPRKKDLLALMSLYNDPLAAEVINFADNVREEYCGKGVLLRGIIEFSNKCHNACMYCGLNKYNKKVKRYELSKDEILRSVRRISSLGVKTVVLQSGEHEDVDVLGIAELITEIKNNFDIAVTLSLGERKYDDYRLWRDAGADRYLLKIETTNRALYDFLHPGMSFNNRIRCIENLKSLDYQTGSGNIVGLRNQTLDDLVGDLMFFKRYDFDMLGIGPFISHPDTPLKGARKGDMKLVMMVLALVRILNRDVHLPSATSLSNLEPGADLREQGLFAGANVIMLNFTPEEVKEFYSIYPRTEKKKNVTNSIREIKDMVSSSGRRIDLSRGDSFRIKREVVNV